MGGSLGGLAAANVFTRLGATVTVFEKRAQKLESNGAALGFVDVDLWERVRGKVPFCPCSGTASRTELIEWSCLTL